MPTTNIAQDLLGQLSKATEPVKLGSPVMSDTTTVRVLRERIVFRDGSPLDLAKLASLTGINQSSLRNWEYGRTSPTVSVEKFSALCKVLQCDIHQLAQAFANSARLNASVEAETPVTRAPTAEERAQGIKGRRRRGKIV